METDNAGVIYEIAKDILYELTLIRKELATLNAKTSAAPSGPPQEFTKILEQMERFLPPEMKGMLKDVTKK